jgi:thioredoxin-related protein
MSVLEKKIETFANIAIILVAVLLVGAVAYKFFGGTSANPSVEKEIAKGTKIEFPGLESTNGKIKLVVILQKGCHFCSESAPFYQKLSAQLKQKPDIQLIAVFPHSVEEAKSYLKELKVEIDEIKQANFTAFGVRGTPTILLLNEQNEVTESWIGKLMPDAEAEVLKKVS